MIPDSAPIVINCDQYDKGTGRLIIKLYEDDIAYTPTGTAVIQGTKPDGKGFAYSATLSGNTVTADLTEQMTAVAGRVRCQIVVTETTGRTGTFVFCLDVQRSALPDDTDMSESEYQFIEQALEDCAEYVSDAEAWADGERGGVPVTSGDPTYHNNSKYWADMASQYASGGIVFKGSVAFASIPTTGQNNGDMYNITDDFTTDSRFIEGSGIKCAAGTNIVWISASSKWDILATSKIGSLHDLNDVTITSATNGQTLKYDSTAAKWKNVFVDYMSTNLQSLDEFVQNTDTQSGGHNFAVSFKVKDINNIFGVGANSWLKGLVIYQNTTDNAYGNVGGAGFFHISNSGQPYNFYIYGDGSVGSPYTLQVKTVTLDIDDLNDLTDVAISTPSDGQALIYDANTQKWKNGAGGGGSSTLSGLTDVTITTPSNDQVLTYDSNSGEWKNANPQGGASALNDLTDVTITSANVGQSLKRIIGGWVNRWDDYFSDTISTIQNFVEGVEQAAALGGQDSHEMATFFKIQDDGDIFGFGANEYLHGFVSFMGLYLAPSQTDVSGKGIVYSTTDGTPYAFYITGAGTVANPYALTKTPIVTGTPETMYQGLYGMTAITSSNADLNNYTTPGNYYKSSTNFSLSHTPSTNASALAFLRVSTLYEGNTSCIYQTLMIQASSGSVLREWYRYALKSGGSWTFTSWYRNASQATLEDTAGFWSSAVSCLAGDTTATFTDTTYNSSWTIDAYCDDGTGEPIAISKIEVNASNQAVVTFASALANATSVKLHYWK